MATFQTLPGFRDFYPEDLAKRTHIFRLWRQAAATFGFAEYDTPVLEPLDLYRAKSGEEIEGQLFCFTDKGGREVALRPEMTPSVCRLVGARANALKRPIKWFSIGEFYRYERMQKGRGRCFHQLNADMFGEAGPEAEIELIALLIQCMRGVRAHGEGLLREAERPQPLVPLPGSARASTSRGSARSSRPSTSTSAAATTPSRPTRRPSGRSHPGLKETRPRVPRDPLASRRSRGRSAPPAARPATAGRLAEWRTAPRRPGGDGPRGLRPGRPRGRPRARLLHGLRLRGLRPEGRTEGARRRRALRRPRRAGSGGPDLPAVGFAIGDMTFSLLLEERGLAPRRSQAPDVYCVLGGEAERRAAFADIRRLRAGGYRVDYPMRELAFGKQFKAAAESGREDRAHLRRRRAREGRRQDARPGRAHRARFPRRRGRGGRARDSSRAAA